MLEFSDYQDSDAGKKSKVWFVKRAICFKLLAENKIEGTKPPVRVNEEFQYRDETF